MEKKDLISRHVKKNSSIILNRPSKRSSSNIQNSSILKNSLYYTNKRSSSLFKSNVSRNRFNSINGKSINKKKILFDKYEIQKKIGSGITGTVHLVEDINSKKELAIKIIPLKYLDSPSKFKSLRVNI